jgi:hypothetical protein
MDQRGAGDDAECENVVAGSREKGVRDANPDNCTKPSQRGSREARTAAEADNVQNGRQHKKSKLCCRK